MTEPARQLQPPAPANEAACLGVTRSFKGRPWRQRGTDEAEALRIAQSHGVPEIVARLVAARPALGAGPEAILNPSLRGQLPDPSKLADMDAAACRLADAVERGERVAIFGDYDVDGGTSTALLLRVLTTLGAPPLTYIPDRMTEGYGPNPAAFASLASAGARVVVTVDCGTAAEAALGSARALGLDVIVCDHHQPPDVLPPAVALVNPNREDDSSGCGHMAAVGVAFLLAVALVRELRARGRFAGGGQAEPDLLALLDLVALGTICDVVPLRTVNRVLVAQGLKVMARWSNPGLRALAEVARVSGPPTPYVAGFVLGPRLNAGGRIGRAGLGVELLGGEAGPALIERAQALDAYNRERQEIERGALDDAVERVRSRWGGGLPPVLVLAAPGWHPGVVGIVAGRLKDRFRRPTLVIGLEDDTPFALGRGSGRSIPGVDLGAAISAARAEGLLESGGGHAMAAGLTLRAGAVPALDLFLADRLGPAVEAALAGDALDIDGLLRPAAATLELAAALERVGPFGAGNPAPVFALPRLRVDWAQMVGQGHIQANLSDEAGNRLEAIAFRCAEEPLGHALMERQGRLFHLAGRLKADSFRGETRLKLQIEDGAPV
ncbi:MAG: single-stranded-DNA-specific exonuclease RecJ [Alphaproteobacteria bacterium]|nr:single-stranded-DNA-specific exonuclease RecJ [Alphaproteobacteria bacterium]